MAKELIEDYRIGWNFQKNNGGFSIKKKGGSRFNKVNIDSFQEFMIVATILKSRLPKILMCFNVGELIESSSLAANSC